MTPHPGSAAAATPAPLPPGPWAGFGRRGLRNQGVCLGIAVFLWLMSSGGRGNFLTVWLYSVAIGNFCWIFIDGGRLTIAGLLLRRGAIGRTEAAARWPGPGWMMLCIGVGTALGYSLGTAVGDAITGLRTPSLFENRAAVAISLVVAVAATWYFYATERLRAEQGAAEAARRQATESQLALLQSQLEPHMLFNTLANLRVLITLDPPRAQAMLDRLIGYLRATLGGSRVALHPLSAEFERLDDYLALMALRMGSRLQVRLDLPTALRNRPVPALLLQPLVENCIHHGLEPKVEGGRIEVVAAQVGDRLHLTVRDTGVGLPSTAGAAEAAEPGAHHSSHYGTQHVAARLATLYGSQASFQLTAAPGPEGGALALIDLPGLTEPSPITAPPPSPGNAR